MLEKKIHMVMIGLLLLGGINSLFNGLYDTDILENNTSKSFANLFYILVGISAVYLFFKRDTYLPFLGETVLPCHVLTDKVPDNFTHQIKIKVPPNTKVVYWASEPSKKKIRYVPNPMLAYQNYENSGIVTSDDNGEVILKVRFPSEYKVFNGMKKLPRHIHYRFCNSENPGMLSEIYTIPVKVKDEKLN